MTFYINESHKQQQTKLNTYLNNYNKQSELKQNPAASTTTTPAMSNTNQTKFIYLNAQQSPQLISQYLISQPQAQHCYENKNYSAHTSELFLKTVLKNNTNKKFPTLNQQMQQTAEKKCLTKTNSNCIESNENLFKNSQNNNKASLKNSETANNNEQKMRLFNNNIETSQTEIKQHPWYLNKGEKRCSDFNLLEMKKFEELQKIGVLLRKALKEAKTSTARTDGNSPTTSDYCSSSNNNSCMNSAEFQNLDCDECLDLAFDNLTYMSSLENLNDEASLKLPQQQQQNSKIINSDMLKKSLKYIKRKDRLKKNQLNEAQCEEDSDEGECGRSEHVKLEEEEVRQKIILPQKSMPDLSLEEARQNPDTIQSQEVRQVISNSDYEKRLKALFRAKSFSRSLRRAKTVFYKNQRSKSLEDLSVEERADYLAKAGSSRNLNKRLSRLSRNNSTASIDSHSSMASSGLASDISSSYFHELSDWSPEMSGSESESSDDDNDHLFTNFDWEKNLGNVALSGFNSSDDGEDEEDEDEEDERVFKNIQCLNKLKLNRTQTSLKEINEKSSNNEERLSTIFSNSFDAKNVTSESLENMLNEVMSRILLMHSDFFAEANLNPPASHEFIKNLKPIQICTEHLNSSPNQQNQCSICLGAFELDDEATQLPCDHFFHLICIKVWLSKSATCPICRHSCTSKNHCSLNEKRSSIANRETLI